MNKRPLANDRPFLGGAKCDNVASVICLSFSCFILLARGRYFGVFVGVILTDLGAMLFTLGAILRIFIPFLPAQKDRQITDG